MEPNSNLEFLDFVSPPAPLQKGIPAPPRPAGMPRRLESGDGIGETEFLSFEGKFQALPPGTPAKSRPRGRERSGDGEIETLRRRLAILEQVLIAKGVIVPQELGS